MTLSTLLARSSWQFYRHHPAQLLLSILGILLGVAIVTAVLITNNSSQRAFALSSEALYGRTTHQLTGALGIEQSVYVQLRKQYPNLSMAPVIQGHVSIGDEVFSILGLDPFSEANFRRIQSSADTAFSDLVSNRAKAQGFESGSTQTNASAEISPLQNFMQTNALLLSDVSAQSHQWSNGQALDINTGSALVTTTLAGTFSSSNPAASTGLLLGDIALVQTMLNRGTRIDRIDLILDDAQRLSLSQQLPPTLQLTAATSQLQTMRAMTRGFHINLTAMSLLALVVGLFLIHNTMTFAVVQRRELFAIKRIAGITARMVLFNILAEALVISLIGSILGILLGYALAHILINLTTQTINDLYFVLHVQQIHFSHWLALAGLVLGVGSSLLAASLSAIDAASTSPVQARQRSLIEQKTRNILPQFATVGVFIMLLGLVMALLPLQSLLIGFAALMLLILGYGLTLPWLVRQLTRGLRQATTRLGISISLAIGGIERNISRTGLAIAALTIAVSATFGVDIMIGSFRYTVDRWLGTTLQSDIYISSPSAVGSQIDPALSPSVVEQARIIEGVKSVSTGRTVSVNTAVGVIKLLVLEPHEHTNSYFELIESLSDNSARVWQQWSESDSLMISEPLARRHGLSVGDNIEVFTEQRGYLDFPITAIFRDFGSSHGKLLMSRAVYSRFWNDIDIGTLGLLLNSPEQDQQMIATLRQSLSSVTHPLLIRSNTAIHQQSLAVFDRTFEVTRVLRWLTVGVAFVGIFSALLALHLERAREFAIIRATGATRQQIMLIVVLQTFIMGLLAGLLALPLGWLMSEVLIKVINVRSFGWTMQSLLPEGSLIATLVLAIVAAVLAGVYPAWRLSRAAIASQLRND